MPNLDDFVAKALSQRGDPYVFGAEARFDDANPLAFDCSELVEWASARCGVRFVDGAQNQRNVCRQQDTLIKVNEGITLRGALLFRIDEGPSNDHVAISLGDGRTIEARSTALGVNTFPATGRSWTHAATIPGFDRGNGPSDVKPGEAPEDVRWVQRRLQMHGFDPGPADGVMGPRTRAAIRKFQRAKNLTVDGIAGPITKKALRVSVS